MIRIVHHDDIAATVGPTPRIGDEIPRGRIAGPSRLRRNQRPAALAKRSASPQRCQQATVEVDYSGIQRLDGTATQMYRQMDACALELALVEEAQAGRKIADDGGCLMPRPNEGRPCPGLIVVLQEAGEAVLILKVGGQMRAKRRGISLAKPVVKAFVIAIVEALLLQL